MRIAIICVTLAGAKLGQQLSAMLQLEYDSDVYEKSGREGGRQGAYSYEDISSLLEKVWTKHDAFVFIMAVGIVVRSIAPFIKHKSVDPAVVVMDELGLNCVSLLSGHLGGANDLTRKIAALTGANPVITTASDINGLLTPDAVAGRLNLVIESYTVLKKINACIVAKEKVDFYVDSALPEASLFVEKAQGCGLTFALWHDEICLDGTKGLVFVSEKVDKKIPLAQVLYLRPRNIIAGMGCRRGIEEDVLRQALQEAFLQSGYSDSGLKAMASAWVKRDEVGLLGLAESLRVPVRFYDRQVLEKSIQVHGLQESEFVKREIGVGNVCEAAALTYSQEATLVKGRSSYGKVTVALARVNFLS